MKDKAMLNEDCYKMPLYIPNLGEGMPDKQLKFGQRLQSWINAKDGMNARKLAKLIGKSPAYVGYLLKDLNPSTGKPIQIKGALADRIATALEIHPNEVREAAGLKSIKVARTVDEGTERLLQFYADLPPDSKSDMVVIAEALWKKHRVAGNRLGRVGNEDAA